VKKKIIIALVFIALTLLVGLFGMNWVVQKYLLSRDERGQIENALKNNDHLSQKFGKEYSIKAVDAGSEVFFNPDGSKYGTYAFLIKSEHGVANIKVKWRRNVVSDGISIEVYETTNARSPDLLFSAVIGTEKNGKANK